jgi:diaminopimelate epimerase
MRMKFTKMQGIGNDFVMVDTIQEPEASPDWARVARLATDRRLGIGGDGLILVERGDTAPFRMRMFNPDGSESEMCGNGIRCFGQLLQDHGYLTEPHVGVETGAGILKLDLLGENLIRVDMGQASLTRKAIGMVGNPYESFISQSVGDGFYGTAVSMGNPHLVIFVEDVQKIDLEFFGPRLERQTLFPNRTNVHFVQVTDRQNLIQRTWERGAGVTLACGTGACSCGVAGFLTGRSDRKVDIQLPGGKLQIEYLEDGRVIMAGPAETVFEGEFDI